MQKKGRRKKTEIRNLIKGVKHAKAEETVVFISIASSKSTPGDECLGSVIEKPIWFLRDPKPSVL